MPYVTQHYTSTNYIKHSIQQISKGTDLITGQIKLTILIHHLKEFIAPFFDELVFDFS
jgi:hypothetical protein